MAEGVRDVAQPLGLGHQLRQHVPRCPGGRHRQRDATLTGVLAVADVLPSGSDRTALKGHAFLWDPWFLVWGLALGTALLLTRVPQRRERVHQHR